ncbi:MAG: discoidin domain-containing protein, partial [Bryobacteraceae bacterium]
FQVFDRKARMPSMVSWRVTANPNPWDARLAFDNNLATRWRPWQQMTPGMFVEADFGETKTIDEARLVTAPDASLGRVRLAEMDASGKWRVLHATPSISVLPIPTDLRASSTAAMLARGIQYVLVSEGSFEAEDFRDHAAEWSAKLIGESGSARLYQMGVSVAAGAAKPVPATPAGPVPPGAYDDADSQLIWQGLWSHDTQFPDAAQHTVSYSNIPGSSVSLAFTGDEVVYVYTRARNRGIAEAWIDGLSRGRVDLYSTDTRWQSRTNFAGLGPGRHVIEIRVTGDKVAAASDSFADLDEFIVK